MSTLPGGDPSLLRRLNVAAVLRALYDADELTVTELVKVSELSRPTVEEIVASLQQQGLAEEVPAASGAPRSVGRPAKRYRFQAGAGHLAGLDIGPHKVLCLVTDLRGDIVASARLEVRPELRAADRLAAARSALRVATRGRKNVRALGVGTTGVVAGGKVVVSQRLVDWQGVDLAGELGARRSYPVLVGNDTKLATLAEHWRGAAKGARDVIYVLMGRSISAGLLLGGKLHAGHNGGAGEIGVLRDLGWYTALDRFLAYGNDDPASPSSEAAKRVFDAVRQGDCRAAKIVASFVDDLATGVAAAVLTVDPQLVVIGGGLSQAGDLLAEPLRASLARRCLFPVQVETSTLGEESVALGAIRLALDHLESELLTVVPSRERQRDVSGASR